MAAFLTVWLFVGTVWANSAPLLVAFAPGGPELPQAAIRVAVGTELGREALAETAVGEGSEAGGGATSDALSEQDKRERVVVAVDELGQLWVRYWGPRGLVDRHLAMPEHPEQLPLVVSLAVGNLVRQEAFELLRDLERRRSEQAKPAAVEPAPAPAAKPAVVAAPRPARKPRPEPVRPRNSWGHFLARDLVYVPTTGSACTPTSELACYDSNDEPTFIDVEGTGIAGGVNGAHSRYLMGYARLLAPDVWGAVRLGVAFSGGKAKNRAAEHDASVPKFWPWLVELRLQYFPVPGAFNGALRPYVHATAGSAEATAEMQLTAPFGSDGTLLPVAKRVTAVHSLGLLFAGAGAGVSLALFDGLRLEGELSGFVAFPSSGWFARPSIGLTYDF